MLSGLSCWPDQPVGRPSSPAQQLTPWALPKLLQIAVGWSPDALQRKPDCFLRSGPHARQSACFSSWGCCLCCCLGRCRLVGVGRGGRSLALPPAVLPRSLLLFT